MSIHALGSATPALRSLNEVNEQLSAATVRLASGKRIGSFADSPADAVSAVNLGRVQRSLTSQISVLEDRISAGQVADGGYAEAGSALARIKDLQLAAQSGSRSEDEVAGAQTEIDSLIEAVRAAYSATYGGRPALETDDSVQAILDEGVSATGDISQTHGALYDVAHRRAEGGTQVLSWEAQARTLETAYSSATGALSRIEDMDAAEGATEVSRLRLLAWSSAAAFNKLLDVNAENATKLLS